jgi:hypothetical protein
MVYLCEACDQISDFCHQWLLRKMRQKISWKNGRTERRTEVKQYTPYGDIIRSIHFLSSTRATKKKIENREQVRRSNFN